ncbi:MAG TPA: 16S rRNA (adenine(1518)-N(6)/adenine(1519)-N(6))-dimethyltransferase RsmA [Spirochaetia bacterium]|nr:16S rRNA (adenine(1518)-N(6)/adenine(1519)-N(6))-dimethyltransferase RsmA [Spirochaetales bacterium]HRY72608.1 16S rRNA (adenine(1518)-N(6)/adenine(1519)-N(6))-dimethyltransferase RsmA [Spirochaetia bacterium]
MWEIGPGIGSMTAMALDSGLEVTAFEIDRGFARLLGRIFAGRPKFRLVEGDFLRTWKTELAAGRLPDAVFGNLPYNVASAMVALLIERYPEAAGSGGPPPMVFTVQKEAALRMAAKPGTKDYSAFSVLCASACRVRIAFDLAGGSFWPVPNVQSSLVVLEPRPDPIAPADRLGFSAFVRSAFSSRRKTLKNNLKAAGRPEAEVAAALEALGFSPSIRAEALRPEELAAVYGRLKAAPVPPLPTGAPGPYDAEL